MAQKKTNNQPRKKVASRFYVVRSFQDVRKKMSERMQKYHRDFIKDPLQSGKEVLDDLREDPRKAMDTLMDDSRRFVVDLKKEAQKKVKGVAADGKKFYTKASKNPRKTFNRMVDDSRDKAEELIEDGRSFMNGVEKDARIVMDEVADSGKKALNNLPGKEKIQNEIEKRVKSLPQQFNMPSRNDINLLTGRLEALNVKIDTLGKEVSV
jgi:polyhydroxyalkanoate synthesis regulator phasin